MLVVDEAIAKFDIPVTFQGLFLFLDFLYYNPNQNPNFNLNPDPNPNTNPNTNPNHNPNPTLILTLILVPNI